MELETPFGTLRTHFINDNVDKVDRERKGRPTKGRFFVHLGDRAERVHVEWVVPSASFAMSAKVESDCEGTLTLHVALPPASLFFVLDSMAISAGIRRALENLGEKRVYSWEREISLRVHDWAVWWRLWSPATEWHSTTPKWRDGSWRPFGFPGSVVERDFVEQRYVDVPFPAKTYRATATRHRIVIRHPLFPLLRKVASTVNLNFEAHRDTHGMPEGRKGCTFEASSPARSIDEAVGKFVGEELRYNRGPRVERPPPRVEIEGQAIIAEMRDRAAKQAENYVPPEGSKS